MRMVLTMLLFVFCTVPVFGDSFNMLEREKKIIKREEELKKEEEKLMALKKEVEEKIRKYSDILTRIESLNANIDKKIESFKDNNINQLAKLYSSMSPKNAAQRLAQLDDETAAKIIMKMSQKNASEILSSMEVAKAASITKYLTQIEKKIPAK